MDLKDAVRSLDGSPAFAKVVEAIQEIEQKELGHLATAERESLLRQSQGSVRTCRKILELLTPEEKKTAPRRTSHRKMV